MRRPRPATATMPAFLASRLCRCQIRAISLLEQLCSAGDQSSTRRAARRPTHLDTEPTTAPDTRSCWKASSITHAGAAHGGPGVRERRAASPSRDSFFLDNAVQSA